MRAFSLGALRVGEALRAVAGLGAHRYVAGRMHLVHALAFEAAVDGADRLLEPGKSWAKQLLEGTGPHARLEVGSRDDALWRRSTEAEVVAILDAFWTPGQRADASRDSLRALLDRYDLGPPRDHAPFEESLEDSIHPLLIDAGWELLSLSALDPARHKGAISAFGDPLAFASACFEEATAIPSPVTLLELPAFGPTELLGGATGGGDLLEPLVVWAEGNDTYVDYVVRGVRRAAGLPEREQ
jgi:hypothetical protein